MNIKSYARKYLNDSIVKTRGTIGQLESTIANAESALKLLDADAKNRVYVIHLMSYWTKSFHDEGEKNVRLEYKGSLANGIKEAEKKFKSINKRSNVDAQYRISLKLGNIECPLPKDVWEQYTKPHE